MSWYMTGKSRLQETMPARIFATPGLAVSLALCLVAAEPAVADATVYRCGPQGSQWYSQIPCAEDSEAVVIKDQHMLGDSDQEPDAAETSEGADETAADTPIKAEAFITQLEKQRSEQLAVIDRDIARLQTEVTAEGEENTAAEGEENTAAENENAALLAGLQNTRESIVSEYEAMIRAAQQRIAKP